MKQNRLQETNRNVGLDLLRIISMIMVLMLHYLGKGQITNIENVDKMSYIFYSLIESLVIVAVNCYVLISGYFLVKSEFKFKKLFKLWGEVVFYSIMVYLVVIVLGLQKFSIKDAILACFPVITKQYWFITTYMALYILSPFINKLIYALTKEEYKKLLIILLVIFSLVSILPSEMLLDKTGGYGIIWFICLYLIAAYIRLYITKEKIMKYKKMYIPIYILLGIITTIGVLILQYIFEMLNLRDLSLKLLYYNMPLVLIESICLFLFCNTIEIKNKFVQKVILFIAPLTFAVYIIHEQPVLSKLLYTNILYTEICYHNPYSIFIIIGSVLAVFVICIGIEYIRTKLFELIKKICKCKRTTCK